MFDFYEKLENRLKNNEEFTMDDFNFMCENYHKIHPIFRDLLDYGFNMKITEMTLDDKIKVVSYFQIKEHKQHLNYYISAVKQSFKLL